MIVTENCEYLKKNHPGLLELSIAEVRIGLYMLAVKLSDGSTGLSSCEPESEIHCDKKRREYGKFSPLHIKGRTLSELFEFRKQSPIVNALRIAALHAVSTRLNEISGVRIIHNTDPIDLIELGGKKHIAVIGAFHNYIKKIIKTNNHLQVLELNEMALLPEHRRYYRPADKYPEVLPLSDIVMITGYSLVNNTFDNLLETCNPKAQIVVIGPSSNVISEILFSKNVDIIGGILITRPDLLLDLISEGGSGYHLYKYCAEKICILNEKQ